MMRTATTGKSTYLSGSSDQGGYSSLLGLLCAEDTHACCRGVKWNVGSEMNALLDMRAFSYRRRRDNNGYNNNGYNNGYNNNYGRKLKQGGVVANIICDALGNCDDGRGRRYYDEGRDDRR